MKIQDFADMQEFERIISNWAVAIGMAAVAIDDEGKDVNSATEREQAFIAVMPD